MQVSLYVCSNCIVTVGGKVGHSYHCTDTTSSELENPAQWSPALDPLGSVAQKLNMKKHEHEVTWTWSHMMMKNIKWKKKVRGALKTEKRLRKKKKKDNVRGRQQVRLTGILLTDLLLPVWECVGGRCQPITELLPYFFAFSFAGFWTTLQLSPSRQNMERGWKMFS